MEPETVNSKREADSTPNDVVLKSLDKLLQEKFPNSSFDYVIEKASGKGDNYLGVVYRVIVKISGPNQGDKKTYKLIIKTPPESELQRQNFMALDCFHHEVIAYNEFLPLLIEFQKSKGLGEDEIFKSFPECYKIMTDNKNEAIFLEDLSTSGFRMFNRFDQIDVEHVSNVMRAYGQLHAVSFAMKDQAPDKLTRFMEMEDIFKKEALEMFGPYFDSLKERSINSLDDTADHEYKVKYAKFLEDKNIYDLFLHYLNGKLTEAYSVVCHGDCWNNNILFHYNGQDKPTEASLIDWQIIRFASPITDILYYLFSSTHQNFRKQHFQNMMNIYYNSLSEHITRLGSDPEKMFPRDVFEENLMKFGVVGLLFAMMVLPVIVVLPKDVVDMEEMSRMMESQKNKETADDSALENLFFSGDSVQAYRKRMREVIIDVIDYGYLDV